MSDTGLQSDKILVGTARGAGLWIAPPETAIPATIAAQFATGWRSLGYATEDGPTVSTSTDTTDIRGWQALGVLRTVITGRTVTIQFQLMEWSLENLAIYWDIETPTETAGAFSFDVTTEGSGRRHMIGVDIQDGPNQARLIFPRTQLQAAGDMQFQRSSAAGFDVTFSALEHEGSLVKIQGTIPGISALAAPLSAGAEVQGAAAPAEGAPAARGGRSQTAA